MGDYTIKDFTKCPESSCDNMTPVKLDYYHDGENIFLSFNCPNCTASSLEDDFEWYVQCPYCHYQEDGRIGRVERIEGGILDNGLIWFECSECGNSAEGYVSTRWSDTSEISADEE